MGEEVHFVALGSAHVRDLEAAPLQFEQDRGRQCPAVVRATAAFEQRDQPRVHGIRLARIHQALALRGAVHRHRAGSLRLRKAAHFEVAAKLPIQRRVVGGAQAPDGVLRLGPGVPEPLAEAEGVDQHLHRAAAQAGCHLA